MKTGYDNNLTNHTGTVYTKNKTKLSWPIRLGVVCDNNMTDCIGLVYFETKTELSGLFDQVQSMMKTR